MSSYFRLYAAPTNRWPSPTGLKVKLSNGRTVTNLASNNIFNFIGNDLLKERAIATLRYYGVGACGPPGFYGTKDVDMKAEADIANFIGIPDCIIYSQAFSTISSVIPAFSKRGDIIVADKSVNYAIRKGIEISRSTVYWYEHNNLEDLERVLAEVEKTQKRKKKLTRRFIVTEGLFEKSGDIVDLPKIVRPFIPPDKYQTNQLAGRTQVQVQVPPHPRRNMVLPHPWTYWPRFD